MRDSAARSSGVRAAIAGATSSRISAGQRRGHGQRQQPGHRSVGGRAEPHRQVVLALVEQVRHGVALGLDLLEARGGDDRRQHVGQHHRRVGERDGVLVAELHAELAGEAADLLRVDDEGCGGDQLGVVLDAAHDLEHAPAGADRQDRELRGVGQQGEEAGVELERDAGAELEGEQQRPLERRDVGGDGLVGLARERRPGWRRRARRGWRPRLRGRRAARRAARPRRCRGRSCRRRGPRRRRRAPGRGAGRARS